MSEDIRQGTTPLVKFNIPIKQAEVDKLYLTFKQGKEVLLEKDVNDVTQWLIEDITQKVKIKLSQADTNKLKGDLIYVQVRVLDKAGNAYASTDKPIYSARVLKEGVI